MIIYKLLGTFIISTEKDYLGAQWSGERQRRRRQKGFALTFTDDEDKSDAKEAPKEESES